MHVSLKNAILFHSQLETTRLLACFEINYRWLLSFLLHFVMVVGIGNFQNSFIIIAEKHVKNNRDKTVKPFKFVKI